MARTLIKTFKPDNPVGSVMKSMLTEAQFQAEHGVDWVLADGRSVTGSRYETVTGNSSIPDMRGQFLRGKNNGRSDGQENPDGEVNLGVQTGDGIRNITGRVINFVNNVSRSEAQQNGVFYSSGGLVQYANPGSVAGTATYPDEISMDASLEVPTSDDNRPKNVTVNIFIKIN